MNTELIVRKLERLAELRAELEAVGIEYTNKRESAIPDDIKNRLAWLQAEQLTKENDLNETIARLESEVRQDVLFVGVTVKSGSLMAVWNKGRVSWDSKLLDGYAVAHPEILAARKEGDPSVTIRTVK